MATIQDLRELFGGSSDFETIDLASKDLGLSPAEIADELGMGSRGGKNKQRMSASVDRYQAGLYGVGEAVSGAVGLTGVQNWMRSGRVANETEANVASERARNLGAVDSWAQVHTPSDFGDYAVGLGIQSLPYMGEALAGGFAGRAIAGAGRAALGSTVGVTAASYPSGMGDILQNQREQSGQTDLLSAAGLAIPYAAANVFGVEGALARGQLFRNTVGALDNMNGVRGGLSRAGVTVGRTALTEGASETFQEGMNQFGRMAVDPSETFFNEQSNERFVESFVGGAILGGITGGVAGGWRRSQQWVDSHQPINVLPDAPAPGQYTPPDSLTNTPVTELPGFASRPQDPLQEILNPPPPGPSVTINPNAANEKAVANGTATPQQTKAAQVAPEERQAAGEKYRMETVLDDGTEEGHWRLFGRDFFKRADLNKALDRQAIEDRNVDPGLSSFAKELNYATTPIQRPQVLNELARTLYGSTPEKTAYNLNAAIAGGHKEAERLAATYEKLTGKEAPAWKALQEKPAAPAPAPKPAPPRGAVSSPFDGKTVVYHGTTRDFKEFDPSASASHTKLPGIFFTANPASASNYAMKDQGANVRPVTLTAKAVKTITTRTSLDEQGMSFDDVQKAIEEAKRAGHDAVVLKGFGPGLEDELVVFSPDQIKPAVGKQTTTEAPTFEEDDFDGMARATLMKLFNGNERSVEIALADLQAGGEQARDGGKIAKDFGVSPELVRKIRMAYTAPKRLELAAKQAGVPLETLQAALEKRKAARPESNLVEEGEERTREIETSDDTAFTGPELTEEQAESDAFANGMSIRTDSGSQIADVGERNISRSKFEKAKQNLQSRSLTLADLNNLYEEFINEESDAGDALAQKVVAEVERRHKYKLFDDVEQSEVDKTVNEGKGKKRETRNAVLPAGQEDAGAPARKGSAAPAAGKTDGAKKPEGPVADAWDKMASQVKKAGLDLPTWDKLSSEQKIKAQDKFVLNGKLDMREAQKVLSAKEVGGLPPKRPEAPPALGMYAGEKSAAKFVDKHKNFLVARSMIEHAEDPEKVRLATGWFKGPHDKKWRHEISDDEAKLVDWEGFPESKLFGETAAKKLGDVLDHPKLFEAYPEAKNILVVKRAGFLDFGGLQGWFNGKNEIGITPYAKDPLSTLLHEVQHWIQRQEGYATGGNENMVWGALTPEQKKRLAEKVLSGMDKQITAAAEEQKVLSLVKDVQAMPEFQAVVDTEEAFQEAAKVHKEAGHPERKRLYDINRQAREALYKAMLTKFSPDVLAKMDRFDSPYFKLTPAQRSAISSATFIKPEQVDDRVEEANQRVVKLMKTQAALRSGDEAALKEALTATGENYNLYRAIAGEIEARDVQFRQKMTDEERKKHAPFTGEKFDPADVIVTYDKGDEKSTSREAQAPLIELRKRESVLKSLLNCLG